MAVLPYMAMCLKPLLYKGLRIHILLYQPNCVILCFQKRVHG